MPIAAAADNLFEAFFDLSLIGGTLLAPVQSVAGEVTDFTYVRLNPMAQQLLAMPEHPAESFLTRYPHALVTGVFAFYREAYESGEVRRGEFNYQYDGLDNYFHLAARRVGEQLLVSFSDTSEQPRSAVEEALRESQVRERAARAEAETQRQRLHTALMQMPASINLLDGPGQVVSLINTRYAELFPGRSLLGRSFREAVPELEGQGYFELSDQVYQTGEPVYQYESEAWADFSGTGRLEQRYYNISFQPIRDAQGQVTQVLNFSVDVTAQVVSRQQVQALNEELSASNEELRASNEEYQATNTALTEAQQALRTLNQELETRVQARTHELQAAQMATERQRRQWEELFRTAPAAICIFNGPDWVYEFVNPGYQAMFPGRELLGKPLLEALPELHGQPLVEVLRHVYDTGETFQQTDVLVPLARHAGGPIENIYFDLTYLARYNEVGQIDGFITYAYDVTEQVLAQREREARQGELQRLFEQAPVAISILGGRNYIVELANPKMAALWGPAPAELLGRPLFEVIPDAAGQGMEALMNNVMATGEPFVSTEAPVQRHQGGGVATEYFSFVYQPLADEQGPPKGILLFAIDVTEQVLARQLVEESQLQVQVLNEELTAANEELLSTNRRLTRTNHDLDTFVYTASHDLKAPITNIEGILNALRDILPPEVQEDEVVAHLMGLLDHTVGRFRATIHQLTDLTRLQLTYNESAELLLLAPIVADVLADMAPAVTAAAAQVHVSVPAGLQVSFAPASLRSIVYNLLSNAVKYHSPERQAHVWLQAEAQPGQVVLTVRDNGLGLTESQQGRLFGVFQRLHTHVEGTGVGLYMIKRLIENAGATITVTSTLTVGSTFTVTFPAK